MFAKCKEAEYKSSKTSFPCIMGDIYFKVKKINVRHSKLEG
jgi:hypothetical protein